MLAVSAEGTVLLLWATQHERYSGKQTTGKTGGLVLPGKLGRANAGIPYTR